MKSLRIFALLILATGLPATGFAEMLLPFPEGRLLELISVKTGLATEDIALRQVNLSGSKVAAVETDDFDFALQQWNQSPGRIHFIISINRQDRRRHKIKGNAILGIWLPVWVARDNISHGQILEAGLVKRDRHLFWSQPDTLSLKTEKISGYQSRGFVAAGDFLQSAMFETTALIKKKSALQLVILNGYATVETTGTALENGVLGQQIAVFCSSTGKKVYAEVVSSQKAIVRIKP